MFFIKCMSILLCLVNIFIGSIKALNPVPRKDSRAAFVKRFNDSRSINLQLREEAKSIVCPICLESIKRKSFCAKGRFCCETVDHGAGIHLTCADTLSLCPLCRAEKKFNDIDLFRAVAKNGNLPMLRYLIENQRFDLNVSDCYKRNISHLISFFSYPDEGVEMMSLALKNIKNINACDKYGQTPLHIAASRNKKRLITLLLNRGAKIDARDFNGKTALFRAVMENNFTMVEWLINMEANTLIPNKKRITPLAQAQEMRFDTIVNMLSNSNS